MPTSKTWPGGGTDTTPASFSIPASGELNWASLSDFLNALGDSAQATTLQKFAVRKAVASPVTVATTDCAIVSDLTVAGAVTVNLPAGANKQVFFIVDGKGDAGTNNITINRNGSDTIAGSTSVVLNENRQGIILIFNSSDTDWKILGRTTGSGVLVNPMDSAGDMIYGGASGVATKLDSGTSQQWLVSGGAGAPSWSNTVTTGKVIDGSADENQLRVQGHSTQTNDIFVVETSAGTDVLQVTTTGLKIGAGTATLTKYETGTFTPTITGESGGITGVSYVTQTGRWTQIGRLVFYACYVEWSAATGGSGELRVGDVFSSAPAAVGSSAIYHSALTASNFNYAASAYLTASVAGDLSGFHFNVTTDNSGATTIQATDASSGSFNKFLSFSGFYEAA
jgi:hypothetical protein